MNPLDSNLRTNRKLPHSPTSFGKQGGVQMDHPKRIGSGRNENCKAAENDVSKQRKCRFYFGPLHELTESKTAGSCPGSRERNRLIAGACHVATHDALE